MEPRILFTKAWQVVEAFPDLADDIGRPPGDEAPLDFARGLLANPSRFDAIVYLAHVLPRREAVWWGCQCLRAIGADAADAALLAAEAWVRGPAEETRRAALALAAPRLLGKAPTWLAMAAGQSGGSIAREGAHPAPAPPQATALAVKAAVILAIAQSPQPMQKAWLRACVEAGIRFAEGGEAKVAPPPRPPTAR